MTTVFIAGSMNIHHLDPKFKERIDNVVNSGFDVVVGDADGADTSIQEYLHALRAEKLTVYCSGVPRNNVGKWPIRTIESKYAPGTRAFFIAKDVAMADVADFGLMIWDAKSTGTLSNVFELLMRKKKSVVFVNKLKTFKTVAAIEQFEGLLECMSEDAKRKADEKIRLLSRVDALKHEQVKMFWTAG